MGRVVGGVVKHGRQSVELTGLALQVLTHSNRRLRRASGRSMTKLRVAHATLGSLALTFVDLGWKIVSFSDVIETSYERL